MKGKNYAASLTIVSQQKVTELSNSSHINTYHIRSYNVRTNIYLFADAFVFADIKYQRQKWHM